MTNSDAAVQVQPRLVAWAFPLLALGLGLLLCIPRYPTPDEPWYLQDISTIAHTLAAGHWIGNENVGWHGFMFKIPPALALLVTGPSLFVVTAVYVLYGVVVCWLMQRLLRRYVAAVPLIVCGMWLIVTSRHFLLSLATVLCEMPATLAALLVFLAVATRANRWLLGMALALVLDAKEGVFFAFAPAVLVWMLLDEWWTGMDAAPRVRVRRMAARVTAGFLPACALLVLMFCSGLVPLNMRNANILGLTTSGLHDMGFNFNPRLAAINAHYTKDDRAGTLNLGALVSNVLQRLRGAPAAPGTNATAQSSCHEGTKARNCSPVISDRWPVVSSQYSVERQRKPSRHGGRSRSAEVSSVRVSVFSGRDRRTDASRRWRDGGRPRGFAQSCSPTIPPRRDRGGLCMQNRDTEVAPTLQMQIATLGVGAPDLLRFAHGTRDLALVYLRKILYFETFSFLSVPFYIVVPAVAMSLVMFRRWVCAGDTASAALPLLLWSYLLVYCARISNGRYLLPVLPLLLLFMVLFLAEIGKQRARTIIIFALTAALVMGGLWCEFRYVQVKCALNAMLLVAYGGVTVAALRRTPHLTRWLAAYCGLLGCVCAGVALVSLNANQGQFRSWREYGYNGQTGQMIPYIAKGERVWVSGFSHQMLAFYLGDPVATAEHTWRLQAWLPKAHLQHRYASRFYGYRYRTLERFQRDTLSNKIDLVIWTHRASQTSVPEVLRAEWLRLERTLSLKDRTVYFLRVR